MRIELGGLDVYFGEQGTGSPLVLVHGLGGITAIWQKVVGPLSQCFRELVDHVCEFVGRSARLAMPA